MDDDIIQGKGYSESNIMGRGADGIMNRDDQLKYKKILEKSKMQNHKPTKEHLMFGVVPNWDQSWSWNDGPDAQLKPDKQTREWHIIDHIIQNIHKNDSKGLDRDYDEDQTDEQSEDMVQQGAKTKKKSNFWCFRIFKQSTNQSCQDRFVISVQNPFYQAWKIFVILSCIISSYIYGYFAAFAVPEKGSLANYIDIGFEIIFLMDMICQFFLEYKPED